MPRLFTAIEIPRQVALGLSMLRGGLPGARWIDVENYHITLRFIGDIDVRTATEIDHVLARIRRTDFSIRLYGVDAFGGNKPHSIYAGIDGDAGLYELQAEHERVLQRIGLKAEARRFIPHVSLARLRGVRDGDIANYLSLRGNFSTPRFAIGRFVLFSSRESIGGGPYIAEAAYHLDARQQTAKSAESRPAAP